MYDIWFKEKHFYPLVQNYPHIGNFRPNNFLFDDKSNYLYASRENQKLFFKYDTFYRAPLEKSLRERMYLVKTGLPWTLIEQLTSEDHVSFPFTDEIVTSKSFSLKLIKIHDNLTARSKISSKRRDNYFEIESKGNFFKWYYTHPWHKNLRVRQAKIPVWRVIPLTLLPNSFARIKFHCLPVFLKGKKFYSKKVLKEDAIAFNKLPKKGKNARFPKRIYNKELRPVTGNQLNSKEISHFYRKLKMKLKINSPINFPDTRESNDKYMTTEGIPFTIYWKFFSYRGDCYNLAKQPLIRFIYFYTYQYSVLFKILFNLHYSSSKLYQKNSSLLATKILSFGALYITGSVVAAGVSVVLRTKYVGPFIEWLGEYRDINFTIQMFLKHLVNHFSYYWTKNSVFVNSFYHSRLFLYYTFFNTKISLNYNFRKLFFIFYFTSTFFSTFSRNYWFKSYLSRSIFMCSTSKFSSPLVFGTRPRIRDLTDLYRNVRVFNWYHPYDVFPLEIHMKYPDFLYRFNKAGFYVGEEYTHFIPNNFKYSKKKNLLKPYAPTPDRFWYSNNGSCNINYAKEYISLSEKLVLETDRKTEANQRLKTNRHFLNILLEPYIKQDEDGVSSIPNYKMQGGIDEIYGLKKYLGNAKKLILNFDWKDPRFKKHHNLTSRDINRHGYIIREPQHRNVAYVHKLRHKKDLFLW